MNIKGPTLENCVHRSSCQQKLREVMGFLGRSPKPYLEPSNYVNKQPFHENSLFQDMDPKTARGAEFG